MPHPFFLLAAGLPKGRRMDLKISQHNLKVFAQAVQCLAKIGKELFLEVDENQMVMRTLNDAKSAFSAFYFKRVSVPPRVILGRCMLRMPIHLPCCRNPDVSLNRGLLLESFEPKVIARYFRRRRATCAQRIQPLTSLSILMYYFPGFFF